jgi:glycosyltransferase involved in cell wall biosynthesis
LHNLGLAANLKIELVAELLQGKRHEIEVLSQGEVVEQEGLKFYGAFREKDLFSATIPVFYTSALPIRRINGLWSALWMLELFSRRHRVRPYDLVLIYNLKLPQIVCALYANRRRGLPVILEYEDDALVDIAGRSEDGRRGSWQLPLVREILKAVAGCVAVSPHLLSRVPCSVPKVLLRGVVSDDIRRANNETGGARRNWVAFSGTHSRSKGLEQLVKAWEKIKVPDWELHIAGHGERTDSLKRMTQHNPRIVFHGLLDRAANARFLRMARIGINPHDVSSTPGNVFAFKIIEYLAAGTHVITTPMGALEGELEAGITYMTDNSPDTIAATVQRVIEQREYERGAMEPALRLYGSETVASSLDGLLARVKTGA